MGGYACVDTGVCMGACVDNVGDGNDEYDVEEYDGVGNGVDGYVDTHVNYDVDGDVCVNMV